MIRFLIFLLVPLSLFSKYQVVTYFPLESSIVRKIAQDEVKIREITHRFTEKEQKLPYSEISKLSNAKIYFHFGLDIENNYARLLKNENPELIVVDLSANVEKIDNNPYIWMDILAIREIAKNVYESLIVIDKYKAEFYKKNYEIFLDEIDNTFLRIKNKLNNSEINSVYVFDDYWEYFTRRFRIKTIKREKRFLSINEVSELMDYTQRMDIKKILFLDDNDYNVALSLGSNLNIKFVEDNIFEDNWQINLLNLTDNLLK